MSDSIALNIDCMEYMKTVPDKYFDLAIVDPPYGIGYDSAAKKVAGTQFGNAAAKKRMYHTSDWDKSIPKQEYFAELFRVSKKQIIWGGNYMTKYLPPSKCFICWDKKTDEKFSNDFADCEIAWGSNDLGVARVFRYLWTGMIQGNMKDKEQRIHPTQKPVALYEWLLKKYAKQGYKILDTHLGSGSSRIAAYDAGLDFVGCEIDKEYFDKQEQRFAEYTAQTSLFGGFLQEEM